MNGRKNHVNRGRNRVILGTNHASRGDCDSRYESYDSR